MRLYIILAWRNLWRNRRRTLLATVSIFLAVLFSLVMRSLQNGTYDSMIRSAVGSYLGYLQVHGSGYWESRSLDESITVDAALLSRLASLPGVTHAVPRLESFALACRDSMTGVAQVVGVDPAAEDAMTGLSSRLASGRYFGARERCALIGSGLASSLGIAVGDSIVLYGEGYQGITAAARLPVAGIVTFPEPGMNASLVYLPLACARWLLGAPDRVTSVVLMLGSSSGLAPARRDAARVAGPGTEVMTWEEMAPDLVQAIQADSAGGVLMLLILYTVIGFGIFGTVMMMTTERLREFGVLIAVGLKRGRLMAVAALEAVAIALMGASAGVAAGIPLLWYLHLHPLSLTGEAAKAMIAYGLEPVLPFSIAPEIFAAQAGVVFVLGLLCALYPVAVIRKLRPVSAMRA